MKTSYTLFAVLATAVYFLACTHERQLDFMLEQELDQHSQTGSYEWYIMPESDDYASLPNQDPKNPVTEAKVRLGNMLFFETGLAGLYGRSISRRSRWRHRIR
jgi:cytochrome c peroxidase